MQLLPFFVTLFGLYFIIFKPMLKYLDERNEQIEGSQKKALTLAEEANAKAKESGLTLQTVVVPLQRGTAQNRNFQNPICKFRL